MSKIKVIVVEDHTVVRDGFRLLLETDNEIEVVGDASDGRKAINLCRELKPDVVLMDISMPTLNGIEATRIITKKCPDTKVIVLSMYLDDEYVYEALRAGTSGFLIKDTASEDLFKAVHEVSAGNSFFSPRISKLVLDAYRRLSELTENYKLLKPVATLSQREREVLQLIAEGKTSNQIAEKLFISKKTVSNHRQNIMGKLEIHDIAGLTRYAMKKGIVKNE